MLPMIPSRFNVLHGHHLPAKQSRREITRIHLKKVFSADIGVESSSQILDILEYACGLILGLAFLSRRPSAGDLDRKS